MTADDVVASIARWSRLSGPGKTLFTDVESWTVLDRYTAQMVLKKPVGIIPAYLGNPYNPALIYEKTVIDIAGDKPLTFTTEQLIGTGPYKFVEFIPDVHVKLVRFEDYVARNDIINGIGGRKTVYHEVLLLNIVPDGSVRVLGTTTKLYDFATAIVPDQYGKLRINPNIVTSVALKGWETAVFNKKLGVFTNVKIRQAFLAALDMEACMKGGLGNADFWILGPHLVPKGTAFYSTAGSQWYNQKNIERAKSLLAEAGYKGEPIRWLVSTDYPDMYNIALISKDQLEKAGFVIDLQVSDWATLIKRRADEKLWDAFSTYFTYSTDPAFISILNPTYLGWYTSPTMEQYLSELRSETDLAKRKIIWDKAQELFWVDVPVIKYGDAMNLNIYRTILEGYRLSSNSFYFFWNVWKES
jgi:peptide/nickel transport system substrate-binding protein